MAIDVRMELLGSPVEDAELQKAIKVLDKQRKELAGSEFVTALRTIIKASYQLNASLILADDFESPMKPEESIARKARMGTLLQLYMHVAPDSTK